MASRAWRLGQVGRRVHDYLRKVSVVQKSAGLEKGADPGPN